MNEVNDKLAIVAILANVRLDLNQRRIIKDWLKGLTPRWIDDENVQQKKKICLNHLLTTLLEDDEICEPFNQPPKDSRLGTDFFAGKVNVGLIFLI